MITAQKLKEITESCDAEVQRLMALLEPELIAAAEAGKRSLACYKHVPWMAEPVGYGVTTSPLVQKLIAELKACGFGAQVMLDGDQYVPRGSHDDMLVQNQVLVIRW